MVAGMAKSSYLDPQAGSGGSTLSGTSLLKPQCVGEVGGGGKDTSSGKARLLILPKHVHQWEPSIQTNTPMGGGDKGAFLFKALHGIFSVEVSSTQMTLDCFQLT